MDHSVVISDGKKVSHQFCSGVCTGHCSTRMCCPGSLLHILMANTFPRLSQPHKYHHFQLEFLEMNMAGRARVQGSSTAVFARPESSGFWHLWYNIGQGKCHSPHPNMDTLKRTIQYGLGCRLQLHTSTGPYFYEL